MLAIIHFKIFCFRTCNPKTSDYNILWRIHPLLGNVSVNTSPRETTRATTGHLFLSNGSVNTTKKIQSNRRRCFSWGPPQGYITGSSKGAVSCCQKVREFRWKEFIWECCCREVGRALEMAVESDWEEMARKELDCEKKTSCVIWNSSETVINPLPGHD
jgi:hypothetical protein